MFKIKYAVFDVDGTLMDSMHMWNTAITAFLLMRGIETTEVGHFIKSGFKNSIEDLISRYSLDMTPEEVKAKIFEILEYYYFNVAAAKPGVKEFLQKLKENGTRMCVATATDRRLVVPALERNGLLEYFDKVFTVGEVGVNKSQPDIYDRARDYMGADAQDVFVFEDAVYAIETAKGRGTRLPPFRIF